MIKIFNVHATWITKGGNKGELNRKWVGPDIDTVHDSVLEHLRCDLRFSAHSDLDIQIWAPSTPS